MTSLPQGDGLSCLFKKEAQRPFMMVVRTLSKIGPNVQMTWSGQDLSLKVVSSKFTAFLEVFFMADAFAQIDVAPDPVTVCVNSKRLLAACTFFAQAMSVGMRIHGQRLEFEIVFESKAITTRVMQLDEEQAPISRDWSNEEHVRVRASSVILSEAFASIAKNTDYIIIDIRREATCFHTLNPTSKQRIESHVEVDSDKFDELVFPHGFSAQEARVSVCFKDYRRVVNLAKLLSTVVVLSVKDPYTEAYLDFRYFNYFQVKFTMAARIEDENTDDTQLASRGYVEDKISVSSNGSRILA